MENLIEGHIGTGIALMNLENVENVFSLQLLNSEGEVLASAQETLLENGHMAKYIHEFDWDSQVDFSDFRGILKATSTGKMAATVIQTRPDQFATMPVTPY